MSREIKKIGIQTLLLATKGLVYLQKLLKRPAGLLLLRSMERAGRFTLYLILIACSPAYGWYRRARRGIRRVLTASPSRWLRPFSHRYLLHGLAILVALVAVGANVAAPPAGAEEFGEGRLVLEVIGTDEGLELLGIPALPENLERELGATEPLDNASPPRTYLSYNGEAVFQPYLPKTENSVAPRTRIETYTVTDGDTLAGIAARYQLRLTTLLDANKLNARSVIRPGDTVTILPVDGLLHTVGRGENIGGIAGRYDVTDDAIISFNRIENPTALQPDDTLIIPGGKRPVPVPAQTPPTPRATATAPVRTPAPIDSGTTLLWPTVDHTINQYYHYRHHGLDIKGRTGVPIYAAEDGTVIESRWGGAYGNMVLIRHDSGIVTRYGHHSKNLVSEGERVTRGQTIALMGSTGRSTGPHLHFEVIVQGQRVNPLGYTR